MDVAYKGIATEIIQELPAPPKWWDRATKAHYKKQGRTLIAAGILKARHLTTLGIMAQNLAQWEAAVRAVNDKNKAEKMKGYIQKFANNTTNISPEVTLKEHAEKQIFICLRRFGLDPKSEKEISATGQLELPLNLDQILTAAGAKK